MSNISFKQEVLRKGIHMLSLSIPIFYSFYGSTITMKVIVPLMLISIFIDVFSRKGRFLNAFYLSNFGSMLREHELSKQKTLNGASWVLLSACFVFLFFPKYIAIAGFSILIISDTFAAIIGRKFGRVKFLTKSLEGTLAFIASASAVVYFVYYYYQLDNSFLLTGIIASVVSAIVEALANELGLDDNIAIPLTFGWVMLFIS